MYQNRNNQQQSPSPSKIQRENGGGGGCFRCHKPGHWAKDCPEIATNRTLIRPPATTSDPEFPSLHCVCGAGFCEIRISGSDKNPGRKYYSCPGKYEKYCKYFKWCDQLKMEEIQEPRHERYPICGCGAGVCSVKIEENGPNAGRSYFACPIRKGDGACNFRQWLDTSPQSSQKIPEITVAEQNRIIDEFDLSYEEARQINALEMGAVELPLRDDQVNMEDEEEYMKSGVGVETSVGPPEVQHPHPTMNDVLENGCYSELTSQSRMTSQNNVQASVNAVVATLSNPIPQDTVVKYLTTPLLREPSWPGQIAYRSPGFVTFSTTSSFFSFTLPKDNASGWPLMQEDSSEGGSPGLNDRAWAAHTSNPSGHQKESLKEGSIMSGTILHAFEKLACHFQHDLITLLESMGPQDHETMMKEAGCTFAALDQLQVDYGIFRLRVTEYIKQAATLAHIEQTIKNNPSSQDLMNRYNIEKSRFEEISRAHYEARATFMDSNKQLALLRENASCIREFLAELEEELSCCEVEVAGYRDNLLQITKTMSECKERLQVASKAVEEELMETEMREIERSAVMAAFEKARAQLRK